MPGCQPVRVEWVRHVPDTAWAHWTLETVCGGCGKQRLSIVADCLAENVELAEKTEQIQLEALHAPDLPF